MAGAAMIGALALSAASVALLGIWSVGLRRLIRTMREVPTARDGLALPLEGTPPRVCVVIPAHNEERHVADLVGSLKEQDYPAMRAVLALDRCTDGTAGAARAAIAGDARFEIVEVASCPEGWAGKVHAVHRGVKDSRGATEADILLFADADCVFDRGCVRATVALMRARSLDLLSLLSTLTHDTWFERLVQPAATLETVTQYPLLKAARSSDRRAFANGQYMMFTREAYDAVGGHEAVRGTLLEDLGLARRIAGAGRPAALLIAAGMARCRMYSSWDEFRRGWKRIYIEMAGHKVSRLMRHAWRVRSFGTLLPLAAAANVVMGIADPADLGGPWRLAAIALGALSLLVMLVVIGALYRLGRTPLWCALGYPLGAWVLGSVLAEAARDLRRGRPILWAGREYVLPAR